MRGTYLVATHLELSLTMHLFKLERVLSSEAGMGGDQWGRDSVGRIRIVIIVTRVTIVALVLIEKVMITVCLHEGRHASFGVSSASCAANALRAGLFRHPSVHSVILG